MNKIILTIAIFSITISSYAKTFKCMTEENFFIDEKISIEFNIDNEKTVSNIQSLNESFLFDIDNSYERRSMTSSIYPLGDIYNKDGAYQTVLLKLVNNFQDYKRSKVDFIFAPSNSNIISVVPARCEESRP